MSSRGRVRLAWLTLVATMCAGPSGCAGRDASPRPIDGQTSAEARRPASAGTRPLPGASLPAAHAEPGMLATVAAAPVQGRVGPGGQPFEVALRTARKLAPHARQFGKKTLDITLRRRAPDLAQYPCSSCHLGRSTAMSDSARIRDAHRNIEPDHPKETGARCSTCHAPDNVELLALQSGARVTIDHAYRLCAQCHVSQVNAWAAGAHGKRLDGWQGRRVVMACADCHDPHHPATDARTPFRPPRLERPRSGEP